MTDAPTSNDERLPFFPKRKKFLLPVLILLAVVAIGSVAGVLLGFAAIKKSPAFTATQAELAAHVQVKQHVGVPFEAGRMVFGKHDKNNGTYDLTYEITGPAGEAGVKSRCERIADTDQWEVTYLNIGVGGRDGKVITLVGDPDTMPGGGQ